MPRSYLVADLSTRLLALLVVVPACSREPAAAAPAPPAALRPPLEPDPAPPSPGDPPPPGEVRFDWGPPCRVPAIQDLEQDGRHARLSFDVVLEPADGRLVMRLDDLRVVPDGSVTDDRAALALNEAAIPPLVVALDGSAIGALEGDRATGALAQEAADRWTRWVGVWVGAVVAPGTETRWVQDVPAAGGVLEAVRFALANHGRVLGRPELTLLSLEQTRAGERVDRVTIATDAARDRPHRARVETRIGRGEDRRTTVRDTAFDWSRAIGCASPSTPR